MNELDTEDLGVHICASVEKPDWSALFTLYRKAGFAINTGPTEHVTVDKRALSAEKPLINSDGIQIWRTLVVGTNRNPDLTMSEL